MPASVTSMFPLEGVSPTLEVFHTPTWLAKVISIYFHLSPVLLWVRGRI